jgi:hypothetical protein
LHLKSQHQLALQQVGFGIAMCFLTFQVDRLKLSQQQQCTINNSRCNSSSSRCSNSSHQKASYSLSRRRVTRALKAPHQIEHMDLEEGREEGEDTKSNEVEEVEVEEEGTNLYQLHL